MLLAKVTAAAGDQSGPPVLAGAAPTVGRVPGRSWRFTGTGLPVQPAGQVIREGLLMHGQSQQVSESPPFQGDAAVQIGDPQSSR